VYKSDVAQRSACVSPEIYYYCLLRIESKPAPNTSALFAVLIARFDAAHPRKLLIQQTRGVCRTAEVRAR